MKKIICTFLSLVILASNFCFAINETDTEKDYPNLNLSSASACLMEASTGEILYEKNSLERLEPASVTKVMSLILIMEELQKGNITLDTLVSGSEHSSSMGGSQIWLEAGEQMSVNEMLKSIVVASANDCTVAMAEHIAGSEETFVERMNEKATELGMENTHFSNCTGLPVENHYTCAKDIAVMTRELLKHETILNYTCIWMDTVRNGQMGLTNTNKLVRFYQGANGMKTGFTSSALYCLSATAKRNNMQLIASVMKGPTSNERFGDAKKLLDYGFASFSIFTPDNSDIGNIKVLGGVRDTVKVIPKSQSILVEKGLDKNVECEVSMQEKIYAPVKVGQKVGEITYKSGDKIIQTVDIVAKEEVRKLKFSDIFLRLLNKSCNVR